MGARSKCRTVEAFALAASLLALSGCATASLRNPVPPALAENAHVPGLAKARFWFDEHLDKLDEALRQLGLSLHLGAGKGTRDEVLPLLVYQPELLSSDDPGQLRKTLDQIAGPGKKEGH